MLVTILLSLLLASVRMRVCACVCSRADSSNLIWNGDTTFSTAISERLLLLIQIWVFTCITQHLTMIAKPVAAGPLTRISPEFKPSAGFCEENSAQSRFCDDLRWDPYYNSLFLVIPSVMAISLWPWWGHDVFFPPERRTLHHNCFSSPSLLRSTHRPSRVPGDHLNKKETIVK